MKKATTIDVQIARLTERGIQFDEGEGKAKEVLLDIGYYRLGFYCFPFEETYSNTHNRTHNYKDGTLFSNVVKLYYLDVDLRNILSKYIYRIEVHFRTNLTYCVSIKHLGSTTWFVDPGITDKNFADNFDLKIYSDLRKNNKIIKHHHEKYINDRFAPAWKVMEFMTFGSMLKIFKSIRDEDTRKKIANIYNINSLKTFENYLNTIITIRNVCAHGGVMFDLKMPKSIANGPALSINDSNRNNLHSAICVIEHILSKVSTNRSAELQKDTSRIFENHKDNDCIRCIIEQQIGYKFQ